MSNKEEIKKQGRKGMMKKFPQNEHNKLRKSRFFDRSKDEKQ